MLIDRLEIRNFGKLKDCTLSLAPGINVIYGENESGKSTLHAFLRGMLFGLERLRGKGARTDSYHRYLPWDGSANFGGSLDFQCGGKRFHLEREFYLGQERVQLVNTDDGEILSVGDGDLKMLLGGINESIFDNTVSVGQLKSETGKGLDEQLQRYLANCEGGKDASIDPAAAMRILHGRRRDLLGRQKEEEESRKRSLMDLQSREKLLQSQQETCREKIRITEEQLKVSTEHAARREAVQREQKKITRQFRLAALLFLLLAAAFAVPAILLSAVWALVFGVLSCASLLLIPVTLLMGRAFRRRLLPQAWDAAREGDTETDKLQGKLGQLREEWQERTSMLENLKQEIEEFQMRPAASFEEDLKALKIAEDTIRKITEQMQSRMGARLRGRMGEILSEITDGAYSSVLLNEQMQIQITTPKRTIELQQLSRGTMEQVYFALRMAVGEILCAQEPMPVILDDVFVMYDDVRLVKTLEWLSRNREQVILFTCQRREGRLSIPGLNLQYLQ